MLHLVKNDLSASWYVWKAFYNTPQQLRYLSHFSEKSDCLITDILQGTEHIVLTHINSGSNLINFYIQGDLKRNLLNKILFPESEILSLTILQDQITKKTYGYQAYRKGSPVPVCMNFGKEFYGSE